MPLPTWTSCAGHWIRRQSISTTIPTTVWAQPDGGPWLFVTPCITQRRRSWSSLPQPVEPAALSRPWAGPASGRSLCVPVPVPRSAKCERLGSHGMRRVAMELVVDDLHPGTDEHTWLGTRRLAALPKLSDRRPRRLVVVAPHPDDEALGAGGLLQHMTRIGVEAMLVAVTDGEASHPGGVSGMTSRRPGRSSHTLRSLDWVVDPPESSGSAFLTAPWQNRFSAD